MSAVHDIPVVDSRPSGSRRVRLLDVEPDLGRELAPAEFEAARSALVGRLLAHGPGEWTVQGDTSARSIEMIVVGGYLLRESALAGRRSAQLLGPGDLVAPFLGAETGSSLTPSWRFLTSAELIVVDRTLRARLQAWPAVLAALYGRCVVQVERTSLQLDIVKQARIELRVMTMLWHYAQRWGRVLPEGIVLPVPLTHDLLGRLVAARRPTVSLAVKQLERDGALRRTRDGAWLLDARFLSESSTPMPSHPPPSRRRLPRLRPLATTGDELDPARLKHRIGALQSAHAASQQRTRENVLRCERMRAKLSPPPPAG